MGIKYWIDKDRRCIRVIVSGNFSMEDIIRSIDGSIRLEGFEPGFDILSDHTKIGEPLTTDQAMQMSSYLGSFKEELANSRWAVVTAKTSSYGMMRMLSVLLDSIPMELQIFKTLEEAEEWLAQPKRSENP